ncbi:hypothetical protein L1787_04265 [Acuticoccus sp. M5D2P5]|uniref:reprolysin-like metallopeptidase n=1 Tax=Acuticoccus kalidii TaxID=2910977 RepID=UPI001F2B6CF6|nr:hypothetical protein [Acuticoccus kalidii]MCF3932631.1 hypothetical protein [Acuticoccus kalidii]
MTKIGAPVIVTYEFAPMRDLPFDQLPANNMLKTAVRLAVPHIESVAGIALVEVGAKADAMVSISYNTEADGVSWAHYPYSSARYPNSYGELTMNDSFESFAKGTYGYEILLHEFGHALGLKHPFDDSPNLPLRLDNTNNTLMSYNDADGAKSAFQRFDKQALKALYGPPGAFDGVSVDFLAKSNTLKVVGSTGVDTLIGVNDDSVLLGRAGNDRLFGREGADRLTGGADNDLLYGFHGRDTLFGNGGDDRLRAGLDDDRAFGGHGTDRLFGEPGDDYLHGGSGEDILFGGAGDDTLEGGGGNDRLIGHRGADIFVVGGDKGTEILSDFHPGQGDQIDIRALDMSAAEALQRLTPTGDNMVLDTGPGLVVIAGAASIAFDQADFIA